MKTLHWKHTDWSARKFIFTDGQETIGQLNFTSSWNFNAVYTDDETKLTFVQKSVWTSKVSIMKDEEKIGEIKSGFFTHPTLRLATGEKFTLIANAWGRNVRWKNEQDEIIIQYEQKGLNSMGKGIIHIQRALHPETQKLLIISGLYFRQYLSKQAALAVATFLPVMAAASNR